MALNEFPKMSLVAQYDDLCRCTNVLTTGCEEEFKMFVENEKLSLQQWKESEKEIQKLKTKISNMESEKKRLETQMKHMKSLCQTEINKRQKIEQEKNSMESQIALIKEVLLADGHVIDDQTKEKLALLSTMSYKHNPDSPTRLETIEESVGSLLSISDIDKTDDDLENNTLMPIYRKVRRSRGKRGMPIDHTSPKRPKSEDSESNSEQQFPKNNTLGPGVTTRSRRSLSEPTQSSPELPPKRFFHRSESDQLQIQTLNRYHSGSLSGNTPVGRFSIGGKLSRNHAFSTKTMVQREKCYPCGRSIGFLKQALRCRDCGITCHPDCKDKCPLPCVPSTITPTRGNMESLADYTLGRSPMIPALIVHCINEIELRGLKEVGLYRVSGSERRVKELREKILKSRNMPPLNEADIHDLCGTVKEFLRSLKEPLIPRNCWKSFVEAAEMSDNIKSIGALSDAVLNLPPPNRDTLTFLVLHLLRIAETQECKMSAHNLARVLGPTVLGYSVATPTSSGIFAETEQQFKVMHRLLNIDFHFWNNLLNLESDVFTPVSNTPERPPVRSTQTPIQSGPRTRAVHLGKTPLTPRNNRTTSKYGRKPFFSSPLLK